MMIQLRVTLPAFPALILLALYATGLAAQESPKLPAANPASSSLAQQVRIKTQQHQGSASSAKAPSAAAKPIATAPSPAANAKAAPEAKAADAAAKPSPAAKPVPASDGASDQPGKAARTPAIKPAKATIRKLAKSPAPAQAQTATQTRLKTKDGTAAAPVTTATEKPPATAAAKQDADKTAATAVGKATASPEAMQQQATEKNAPPAHRQQPAKAAGKEAPALKKLAQPAQPAPGTPPATVEPPIAAVPSPAQTQTPAQTAASPNTAAKSAKAAQPAPAATKPPTAASTPTPTAAAAASTPAVSAVPPQPLPGTLTIVSWGGGYGAAQSQTIIEPFARQTDIKVRQIRHGGAGRELDSRADVVDLDSSALAAACNAGKLLDLDDLTLAPPPSRASVKRDLIDGARSRCGIGSLAWSHVVLVRGQAFKKRRPSTLQHVFDARRYPGKRAFVKNPRYLLEMALMADGVAPAEVYATLDSEEGLSRALAKLSTLRKHIIWVEKVSDAYRLLQSGKAVMAAGFSGRAFRMSRLDPRLRTIWDGQIYDVEYWAIPRSAKNIAAARRFVAYATAPKRLARNARYFPYGPMRKSAVRMARKHAVLNIDLRPYLPTSRRNLRRALRFNASWWALKEPLLKPRFDAWLKELATPRSRRKRQAG